MKIRSVLLPVILAGAMAAAPMAFAAGGGGGSGGGGSAGGAGGASGSTATPTTGTPNAVPTTGLATAPGRNPAGAVAGLRQGSLSPNGGGPIQNSNDIAPAEVATQHREQNLGIAPSPTQNRQLNASVEQDASKLIRQSQIGLNNLPPGVARSLPPGEVPSH